jgi:hypothetical protein
LLAFFRFIALHPEMASAALPKKGTKTVPAGAGAEWDEF